MPHSYIAQAVAIGITGATSWGAVQPTVSHDAGLRTAIEAKQLPHQNAMGRLQVLRDRPARTGSCAIGSKVVSAGVLNIRSAPNFGPVVGKLEKNTSVAIIKCRAGWAQIGADRWVADDYLSFSAGNSDSDVQSSN